MKKALTLCLSLAAMSLVGLAHAEDHGKFTRQAAPIELGTDADYNLDYNGGSNTTCQVNVLMNLTPDQKKRLRASRLQLNHELQKAGIDPTQDPNIQGRKVKAIRSILSEYQFHKYLSMREYCNE